MQIHVYSIVVYMIQIERYTYLYHISYIYIYIHIYLSPNSLQNKLGWLLCQSLLIIRTQLAQVTDLERLTMIDIRATEFNTVSWVINTYIYIARPIYKYIYTYIARAARTRKRGHPFQLSRHHHRTPRARERDPALW